MYLYQKNILCCTEPMEADAAEQSPAELGEEDGSEVATCYWSAVPELFISIFTNHKLMYSQAQKLSNFVQQCTHAQTSANYFHKTSTCKRLIHWSTSIRQAVSHSYTAWRMYSWVRQ